MSEIQTKALHCATEATLIVIHIYENQLICACLLLNESRTWLTWDELSTQIAKNGNILQINGGNQVKYSPT